jgi:hypothetical protein
MVCQDWSRFCKFDWLTLVVGEIPFRGMEAFLRSVIDNTYQLFRIEAGTKPNRGNVTKFFGRDGDGNDGQPLGAT